MSDANLDHTNLNAAKFGGVVNEDVMQRIFDISYIPLPFTEMLQKQTSGNQYREWTTFDLGTPVTNNAHIDGADIDQNDAEVGAREGNYHQTAVKEVRVSTRANASDSIGTQGSLAWQIATQQKKLRRDVEAQMLTNLGSVKGDGSTIAGVSAGLGAWIKTNVKGGTGFTAGGFNEDTGLVVAPTQGTKEALSEKDIRDVLQQVYEKGGLSKYAMSTPTVIRRVSEYMFSNQAAVAQPRTMNNDTSEMGMTMQGSTNVFITDFDQVVKFVANRLQPLLPVGDGASMYMVDPEYLGQSFLTGYRVEPLGKTGLSEKRLMSVDYTLCVFNERAQGMITDIDPALAMISGAA